MIAPVIDPVAISIGPLKIHWYGLMYLFGFGSAWLLGVYRSKKENSGWNPEQVSDLIFYAAMGAILGGRVGYILFYNFSHYLDKPWEIFYVWTGGMSFHGGLLGVIFAMWLFKRRTGHSMLAIMDFAAPLTPIGLFFGRFGNFINHELWGKVTDLPWGMVFRNAGPLPRHPSMLYEMALEGVLLFLIIIIYTLKPRPTGAAAGIGFLGYGSFRFLVEFVRMPDVQLGYLAFGWLTMGQVLSFPMILFGIALIIYAYKK